MPDVEWVGGPDDGKVFRAPAGTASIAVEMGEESIEMPLVWMKGRWTLRYPYDKVNGPVTRKRKDDPK